MQKWGSYLTSAKSTEPIPLAERRDKLVSREMKKLWCVEADKKKELILVKDRRFIRAH